MVDTLHMLPFCEDYFMLKQSYKVLNTLNGLYFTLTLVSTCRDDVTSEYIFSYKGELHSQLTNDVGFRFIDGNKLKIDNTCQLLGFLKCVFVPALTREAKNMLPGACPVCYKLGQFIKTALVCKEHGVIGGF